MIAAIRKSIDHSRAIRILVVDDDPAYLLLMTKYLQRYRYTVLGAVSGTGSLEMAGQADVALVDMIMPGMSGLETIGALLARNPHLEVIASSGCAEREFRPELNRLGVESFLAKPFPVETLIERVERLAGCAAI